MIGKIKGKLVSIDKNQGLVETVSGLSYLVFLTPTLISQNQIGSEIDIFTYLQVREDAMVLFGFQSQQELELYNLLLSVSGVGPKTAYNVIAGSRADALFAAIKENDLDYFSKIPGLGKKTSMKIILELSQKLKQEFSMEKMYLSQDDTTVVDALVALGYSSGEAKQALKKIPVDLSIEEKIKKALQTTTRK